MSSSPILSALASGLPALLLSAHFAWAIAEPLHAWNAELLRNTRTVMACEFFLVHATVMSLTIAGRLGERIAAGAGLAAIYALFLAGFAIIAESTWTVAALALLLSGRLVTAVTAPPLSKRGVPVRAFFNLGIFVGLAGITHANLAWFGVLYFAAQGLIDLALPLEPRRVLQDGYIAVGKQGQARYTGEALEIESAGVWADGDVMAFIGSTAMLVGYLILTQGRGEMKLLGVFFLMPGIVLLGLAAQLATRRLKVVVRQGQLTWVLRKVGFADESRQLTAEEAGRPHSKVTAGVNDGATRFALAIGDSSEQPWIDGFESRADAEALGKMIAAELRHGPSARETVRQEPDVAALLARKPT